MLTNDGPNSIQELGSPSHSGINEVWSARTVHGGFVGVQESALESAIVNLEARKAHGPSERIDAPVFVDKFLELKELCVGAARVVLEPAAIAHLFWSPHVAILHRVYLRRFALPGGPNLGPGCCCDGAVVVMFGPPRAVEPLPLVVGPERCHRMPHEKYSLGDGTAAHQICPNKIGAT